MDRKTKYRQYQRLYKSARRSISQASRASNHTANDEDLSDLQASHQYASRYTSHDESASTSATSQSDDDYSNTAVHSDDGTDDDRATIWDEIDNHQTVSSESDDEDDTQLSFVNSLVAWIAEFQIKHNAIDKLLKILICYGHPTLPKTARTLLKSRRIVATEEKAGVEYVNLGFRSKLMTHFHKYPYEKRQNVDNLSLSLNIDGIPLFNSSNKALWPVLCSINMSPVSVFPIAFCLGNSKPNSLEFLHDATKDLQNILQEGIQDGGKHISVTLRCVVCDAPARSMVKSVKLCTGYFGCDKCCQKGMWQGRVVYHIVDNLELRTDRSFRAQQHQEHHHDLSPFLEVDVDMIKQFPIDYMHQACLGVMKRLLLAWKQGTNEMRLSVTQLDQISARLEGLRDSVPNCFVRKPRGLNELDRWKATEFRQFLLYTGKLVLKDILKPDFYNHFLTFSVAMCLLVQSNLLQEHLAYAHQLLVYFVKRGRQLYGPEFLVYNVHSMLHIAADVATLGPLDTFSAFPFESYLYRLKRTVRSGKSPLVQLVKRLEESDSVNSLTPLKSMELSEKPPNNAYLLQDGRCCEILRVMALQENEERKVQCRVFTRCTSVFKQPCDSSLIGAFKVQRHHAHVKAISAARLQTRALMIEQEDTALFLAILHEL